MSTNISSRLLTEAPRVLVVDGSRVVRQLITRVLLAELPGVEVVGCGSGAEAEQVLGDGVFDFITIALRLPDMDGLELARFVRESAPQVRTEEHTYELQSLMGNSYADSGLKKKKR